MVSCNLLNSFVLWCLEQEKPHEMESGRSPFARTVTYCANGRCWAEAEQPNRQHSPARYLLERRTTFA